MAARKIKPKQTKLERIVIWVRGWSPQVKQGTIAAIVLIPLTIGGWLLSPKSNSPQPIARISGGNNQIGNGNTMVVNTEVTNEVRTVEAVLSYDLAISWTKLGPKSQRSGIAGNPRLIVISTIDTNKPPLQFTTTAESIEVTKEHGLRGRYELKLTGFSSKLMREDLANYDSVGCFLKLVNYEENIAGEDVTLTQLKLQMLVNSTDLYEVSVTDNVAVKLSDLSQGREVSFKAKPFAPEKRVKR